MNYRHKRIAAAIHDIVQDDKYSQVGIVVRAQLIHAETGGKKLTSG